ncbi:MAG: DUF2314 domain-containing protein [Gammaproteobacteria bacterium]
MDKYWELIDRLDYRRRNVELDDVSSENKVQELEKGSKVKLIFESINDDVGAQSIELLWVEILLVQNDKYLGQLEDDPTHINKLQRGELIEFEDCHVFESEYVDPFNSSIKV